MKYQTVLELMNDQFSHLRITASLFEQIIHFKQNFIYRSPEHTDFFSSAYFGLYIPKWTSQDDDWWFSHLLDLDEEYIAECIQRLPGINSDFKVSSNPLSLTMLYLAHVAHTHPAIPDKKRDEYKIAILACLNMRYVSSSMNHYFKLGPTTLAIAETVYNRLSKRFTLKQEGSWLKLIESRSTVQAVGESTRDTKYARQAVFEVFQDEMVVHKLNAIRTTMNDTIKELNDVFRQVLQEDKRTKQTTAFGKDGEGVYLKDLVKSEATYLRYQDQIILDTESFYKLELVEVIESSLPTLSTKVFREMLVWLVSARQTPKSKKLIDTLRVELIHYALGFLQEENIPMSSLASMAERLRKNIIAGKNNNPRVIQCRAITDKLIVQYLPAKRGKLITSERTAIMLYLILRTFAMKYYD